LKSITSRNDFHENHPLTIDRILHLNVTNVMFPEKPRMIARTSGTSGTVKLLPISSFQRNAFFKEGIGLVFYTMVNGVASSFAKNTSSITEEKGGIQWPNLQNHVNGMT